MPTSRPAMLVAMSTAEVNDWLDIAVESVLPQLAPQDRFAIRHDGVEPDLNRAWVRHPQVTVLYSPERSGLARSLAEIISASDEPYIARLDSDDIALPGRFKLQTAYLDANPDVVLVGSLGTKIDDDGAVLDPFGSYAKERLALRALSVNPFIHSSVIFRRDAYERAGGYDPTMRTMEDYELWLRMLIHGEGTVLPERLVQYRIHNSQMTRTISGVGLHLKRTISRQKELAAHLGVNPIDGWARRQYFLAVQRAMSARIRVLAGVATLKRVVMRTPD